MKIAFFETVPWEETYLKSKLSGHEVTFFETPLDNNHLPQDQSYEAISVFTDCKIDAAVITRFPNLKLVATRSTGFDHIDLQEANQRDIVVSNVPTYGENTVAEFAFGLLLTVTRKIYQAVQQTKEKSEFSVDGLQGVDLQGKTIGVVGTGRIGRHTIRIAQGFGMEVLAFDALPDLSLEKSLGFHYVGFNELLHLSDIISLHIPYLPSTRHLINRSNYHKIKRGAILINTARGGVIETEALVKALDEGIISGAGLDVLEEENCFKNEEDFLLKGQIPDRNLKTILENHVLMDRDNVIITPHLAFNTQEAVQRILDTTIENINHFVAGTAINTVKPKPQS